MRLGFGLLRQRLLVDRRRRSRQEKTDICFASDRAGVPIPAKSHTGGSPPVAGTPDDRGLSLSPQTRRGSSRGSGGRRSLLGRGQPWRCASGLFVGQPSRGDSPSCPAEPVRGTCSPEREARSRPPVGIPASTTCSPLDYLFLRWRLIHVRDRVGAEDDDSDREHEFPCCAISDREATAAATPATTKDTHAISVASSTRTLIARN